VLLTAILIYLAITLAIGAWSARLVKNSNDFVLAGRSLPLFLSASALFATWFGSETIFGASSVYLEEGLIGVIEDPFGGDENDLPIGKIASNIKKHVEEIL
jgi:Na+/proline symporter